MLFLASAAHNTNKYSRKSVSEINVDSKKNAAVDDLFLLIREG